MKKTRNSHVNVEDCINWEGVGKAFKCFRGAEPFDHCVIDNFFTDEFSKHLESEIPEFESDVWQKYNNPIEIKKITNYWNHFPEHTYNTFSYLCSQNFVDKLKKLSGVDPLYADYGLNGGGWHIHRSGGKLNTHLDYSIHPKMGLLRKINLIVYLNSDWEESWGGHLGLWGEDEKEQAPGELMQEVLPLFNRAVFLDTTQNSWHGLPRPIESPKDQCRQSMALYFLTTPEEDSSDRGKALFAPYGDQKDDPGILELIKKRSGTNTAADVYGDK